MPRRNLWLIVTVVIASVVCYRATDRNPYGRYFSEIVGQIESRYIDQVDQSELWEAAVKGMVSRLNDPHSQYLPPENAARFGEQINQQFPGIGIQVEKNPDDERLVVFSPIVDSPAYRAGILAGDIIDRIDGVPTKGMSVAEAARRIRGLPGEKVRLTIIRKGSDEPIELPPIEREVIRIESVVGDTRDDQDRWNFLLAGQPPIGYVRIGSFGEGTVDEFKSALEQLKEKGMQALVIDLRNNPGGLLQAAVEICELFLPPGQTIVTLQQRDGRVEQQFVSGSGTKFLEVPIVVLVNGYSASASEIVAACLQDHGRAAVVGARSWGKGTVQDVILLRQDRGKLTLTTAEFKRPSGHNIHRRKDAKESDEWGVLPDDGLAVEMSDEQRLKWLRWRTDRDVVRPHAQNNHAQNNHAGPSAAADQSLLENDPALHKAVEYLDQRIAEKRPGLAATPEKSK